MAAMHEQRPPGKPNVTKQEVALLLPLFGTLLVTPPLINLFVRPVFLFGIPLETLYLFIAWLALVLAGFMQSRPRLVHGSAAGGEPSGVAGQNDNSDGEKPAGNG